MRQLAPKHDAPQHRPRPLPLFLQMIAEVAREDPATAKAALNGLERYQQAPRPSSAWPDVPSQEIGRARLYRYSAEGPPVLLVPSIINPPFVLDLSEDNSLARHLAMAGYAVHLLDWGEPAPAHRDEGLADHVEHYLLPAIERLGGKIHLVGHCLGGSLAIAAAEKAGGATVTLAAPWDFGAYPKDTATKLDQFWKTNRAGVERGGMLPIELLQAIFWQIDPERTVRKFAHLAAAQTTDADLAAFTALEDWANGGVPLPCAVARDLFDLFAGRNSAEKLLSPGLSDAAVGRTLHCVSRRDRIVPAATTAAFGRSVMVDSGHIGMVVGARSGREMVEPLIAHLRRHD